MLDKLDLNEVILILYIQMNYLREVIFLQSYLDELDELRHRCYYHLLPLNLMQLFTIIFIDLMWHRIRLGKLAETVEQMKIKVME